MHGPPNSALLALAWRLACPFTAKPLTMMAFLPACSGARGQRRALCRRARAVACGSVFGVAKDTRAECAACQRDGLCAPRRARHWARPAGTHHLQLALLAGRCLGSARLGLLVILLALLDDLVQRQVQRRSSARGEHERYTFHGGGRETQEWQCRYARFVAPHALDVGLQNV